MVRKMTQIQGVDQYESFKSAMQNIYRNKGRLSKSAEKNYRRGLEQYIEFVNSREGILKQITPDDLILEAKRDVEKAKQRIVDFFHWLQGKEIEGYKPYGNSTRESMEACIILQATQHNLSP